MVGLCGTFVFASLAALQQSRYGRDMTFVIGLWLLVWFFATDSVRRHQANEAEYDAQRAQNLRDANEAYFR